MAIGTCSKGLSGIPTQADKDMVCDIQANKDGNLPDGTHTVTITNSVGKMLERDDKMTFEIGQGIVTPISCETTNSFEITVFDKDGFVINFVK